MGDAEGGAAPKPGAEAGRDAGKGKKKKAPAGARAADQKPKGNGTPGTKPAPKALDARSAAAKEAAARNARTPAKDLDQVLERLLAAWFTRHPDQAFQRAWPGARTLGLGTFGSDATLDWRAALDDAQRDLGRFTLDAKAPAAARAQRAALADWITAEKLELTRDLVLQDPSGYVQRAHRTLLALAEADVDEALKRSRLATLLRDLPAYFLDARASLSAPRQEWIELALDDLADLEEFLLALDAPGEKSLAAKSKVEREPRAPALRAVAEFRAWLLELSPAASSAPARLRPGEFARLLALVSGTTLELGEIEARALRDIARADLPAKHPGPDALDRRGLAQRAWSASKRGLELAQEAKLLGDELYPRSVEFVTEEGLRTRPETAWLRAGDGEGLRVCLGLPSSDWPLARARNRSGALQPRSQAALGLRHGMVGEALYLQRSRANRHGLAAFVGNRAQLEGFGLYALDWIRRIDWVENPLLGDEELARELDRLRLHEAARLLASIELNAEGLSLPEAAEAFRRRTGVDADTAMAEALESRRDPLHGIGYLGWVELTGLEQTLARETQGPRGGIKLVLNSVLAHPELTPARLLPLARETLAKPR